MDTRPCHWDQVVADVIMTQPETHVGRPVLTVEYHGFELWDAQNTCL